MNPPAERALVDQLALRALACIELTTPGDGVAAAPRADPAEDFFERLLARPEDPLSRLVTGLQLTPFEVDVLGLALLPELDDRAADWFLRNNQGRSVRPTLGQAVRVLVGDSLAERSVRQVVADSPLWTRGLLRRPDSDLPRTLAPLHPTSGCLAAIEGRAVERLTYGGRAVVRRPAADPDVALSLEVRPPLRDLCGELVQWLGLVRNGLIEVSGDTVEPGLALIDAMAAQLGRPLVLLQDVGEHPLASFTEAANLAVALGAVFAVRADHGTAWRLRAEAIPPVPTVVVTSAASRLEVPRDVAYRRVESPRVRPVEQARIWSHLLGAPGPVRVEVLANQTRLTPDQVRSVVALARQRAHLEGVAELAHRHVAGALAEVAGEPQGVRARVTRPRVRWSSLIVADETRRQLEEMVRRLQHRVTVEDEWGIGGPRDAGRGLVTMFHGPSGTGKTLAASAIATQVSLPLVQVDLAQMVSKYIGETEKNLASLFDELEGFRAVLFFDEADSLFGKRTQVSDAHDRYANLETSYLLQRLETFEGIAILATNLAQNIDEAFSRRLDFVTWFPRPTPALRAAIWHRHLPAERRDPALDLGQLAAHDLVGGEIRNAAVAAAYEAAARGELIRADYLQRAILRELAKKGRGPSAH